MTEASLYPINRNSAPLKRWAWRRGLERVQDDRQVGKTHVSPICDSIPRKYTASGVDLEELLGRRRYHDIDGGPVDSEGACMQNLNDR
jgi:hypothetical protein